MTNKIKIYLDTSVPSAYYDDRTPQRQNMTRGWWNNKMKDYNIIISEITKKELMNTKDIERRSKLIVLVQDIEVVEVTKECIQLSREYIKQRIIPSKYEDDAVHIAVASIYNVDVLVSWNFRHIVKYETKKGVNGVNLLNGYREMKQNRPCGSTILRTLSS